LIAATTCDRRWAPLVAWAIAPGRAIGQRGAGVDALVHRERHAICGQAGGAHIEKLAHPDGLVDVGAVLELQGPERTVEQELPIEGGCFADAVDLVDEPLALGG
jgi:hypothetical protein